VADFEKVVTILCGKVTPKAPCCEKVY